MHIYINFEVRQNENNGKLQHKACAALNLQIKLFTNLKHHGLMTHNESLNKHLYVNLIYRHDISLVEIYVHNTIDELEYQ